MNQMRFSEIELRNWKNFTSVIVPLAGRMFIVGPNASGKSNFLDAFRLLRDLVLEGGGLAKAIDLRDGLTKVRSLFARGVNTEVIVPLQGSEGVVGRGYNPQMTNFIRTAWRPTVASANSNSLRRALAAIQAIAT